MSVAKYINPIRATRGEKIFYRVNHIFMLILCTITLYPMLYVIFASLSDPNEFAMVQGLLLKPAGFSTIGYRFVFRMSTIWLGYRNTLIYVFAGSAISMALTILAAFMLSRREFMLKKLSIGLIVFTMYWGVMLPGALSVYNTIVLRTSFNAIPPALEESARIDGAGDMRILFNVVLPLSGAALATITLFYVVGNWGAWYNALVYLQDRRDLYPLQMFLREMLIEDKTTDAYMNSLSGSSANVHLIKEVTKYSVIIVSTLPILIVYPFIQKYFVKGVMLGSIKE